MNRPTRITFIGMGICLLVALWCSLAKAAFDTGNDLYAYCTGSPENPQFMLCLGLITGYYEGMSIGFDCPGANPKITREQLKDMVVRFLQENPDKRHIPAAYLAGRAFTVAFNCKKSP